PKKNDTPDTGAARDSNAATDADRHGPDDDSVHDHDHRDSGDHDHSDPDQSGSGDGGSPDHDKTVPELFEDRSRYIEARNDAEARLDAHMPEGRSRSDFNVTNVDNTLEDLWTSGYDPDEVDELQRAAWDASRARNNVNQTTARIGEVGGEQYLDEHPDYEVAGPEFRTRPGETPPGGWSDGAAVKVDGSEFDISEFKGGDANLARRPVKTEFEGPARQGDPAYSRSHLLTDPRFAQYFHDHPDLWESIKRGDTRLNFKAIFTRTPDGPPRVRDFPFDLTTSSGGSEVRDALQARIDALDSASAPPRPNIPEGLAGSCDIASDGDGEADDGASGRRAAGDDDGGQG
ncbi:MAG: hypothetical protein ACFNZX_05870, partial [Actinomyces sp.]